MNNHEAERSDRSEAGMVQLRAGRGPVLVVTLLGALIAAAGAVRSQNERDALVVEASGKVLVRESIEGPGTVPVGAILMWSGDPARLPPGWALCDGEHHTPDLRGRFIAGLDPRAADYAVAGKTGGVERVVLRPEELGIHTHQIEPSGKGLSSGNVKVGMVSFKVSADTPVFGPSTAGPSPAAPPAAHENRPPYLVLAYIMYTGPVPPTP